MSRPKIDTRLILLVFFWLTSGGGCQLLQIPSYRADSCVPSDSFSSDFPHSRECLDVVSDCPPGILPPLPGWTQSGCLARWKAQKDLPPPAPYPRFHPLPTRPMFSPSPSRLPYADGVTGMPAPAIPYGQMPPPPSPTENWNEAESVLPQPAPRLPPPSA